MAGRAAPVRTCVGCRGRGSRLDLLRVVVGRVDGQVRVVPDPRHRLPGRGAWLHPDLRCLELAERRRAFPRALRVPGPLDTGLVRHEVQRQVAQTNDTSTTEAGREADERSMSTQR
ncbi:MAG: YlxR family protein [Actinomycetota bacterium]|nr:YlxR family protein [Actinomycetota bacterium]